MAHSLDLMLVFLPYYLIISALSIITAERRVAGFNIANKKVLITVIISFFIISPMANILISLIPIRMGVVSSLIFQLITLIGVLKLLSQFVDGFSIEKKSAYLYFIIIYFVYGVVIGVISILLWLSLSDGSLIY